MCGIVLSFTPRQPMRGAVIHAMAAALRHRGPDDEGYLAWCGDDRASALFAGADTPQAVREASTPWQPRGRLPEDAAQLPAPLWLGHRRLAIVDLSPWGHQPMRRGSVHIVFNGEIYNHIELRAELEALGQRFLTHSDTEVLLAALAVWGPREALARCNGMWAFVAFDEARRRLLIARDRFGVKPLYLFTGAGGTLLAASEIKALLTHPLVRTRPVLPACVDFARHGPSAWKTETEFEGITRFPPGHWAEADLSQPGPLVPQAFWQRPPAAEHDAPFNAVAAERAAEQYRELLADAVRLRLRADVRVGTALSGGLDSSSIAWLVNQQLRERGVDQRQEVFSSVYRADPAARGADESAFIERVAELLEVRANAIEPRAADVPAAHERLIWALDTPPANTLMSSWHTFAQVARRGVVVTLDGQGADEQLAGYTRYVRNLLAHATPLRALREAWALAALRGFGSAVAIGLAAQGLRRLGGQRVLESMARHLRMGADPSPTLEAALAQDFETHLQNLLLYADKTAMAWSVESRMPFMDYRLVGFLAGLPPAYKVHAGWTKWLARRAFEGRLPEIVTWRRDKMGWAIPEPAWFGADLESPAPLAGWLRESIAKSGFAREVATAAGIDAAGAPLAARLRLLNLAQWHRLFFEEAGRPGRALGRNAGAEGVA